MGRPFCFALFPNLFAQAKESFCNLPGTAICPTERTETIDVADQHTWVRPATRNRSTGSRTRVSVLDILQESFSGKFCPDSKSKKRSAHFM